MISWLPPLLSRPGPLRETHTFLRMSPALCCVRHSLQRPPYPQLIRLNDDVRVKAAAVQCKLRLHAVQQRHLTGICTEIGRTLQELPHMTSPLCLMMARAETLGVGVFHKSRPLPLMRFNMINVSGCYRITLLRTTPTIWFLHEPVSLDRFPDWRLEPRPARLLT